VGTVPGGDVTAIVFTAERLLIQRQEGALEVWDERATKLDHVIAGDPSFVWPPVPDRQGMTVARRRSDSSVVLTDMTTGTNLATIPPDGAEAGLRAGLAFTPDGRRLVTVVEGSDASSGLAVVREVSDDGLVHVACATAGRNLTAEEWQTVVGSDVPRSLSCA
jgi:WD40 repeat protein